MTLKILQGVHKDQQSKKKNYSKHSGLMIDLLWEDEILKETIDLGHLVGNHFECHPQENHG